MDYNRKKRRKAKSVQDMVGLGMMDRPVRKSNYQGPYKRTSSVEGPTGNGRGSRFAYTPPGRPGGFQEYAWIIYTVALIICIIATFVIYSSKTKKSSYTYPLDVVTMSGVLNTIYEEQAAVSTSGSSETADLSDDTGTQTDSLQADGTQTDGIQASDAAEGSGAAVSSGAVMTLDSGQEMAGYTQATSHTELLSQLEGALAAGDSVFVGSKLAYKDEASGALTGYPQSVVEHFTTYMAANADKRTSFMQDIQDETKYSGQSGTAYLVVIPLMRFTVNITYDNTTLSISGFADQVVSAGQSATISPLLPCNYTVTVANETWSAPVSSDVEADINEGNLVLNI
ncbi:MAG: hypothetical protein QM697_00330 [Lachnospiraceae bacterium]